MAAALKRFCGPQVVPNADTVLFTVPGGKTWTIKQIILANTDAANHPITIGIGGIGAGTQIVPNTNVAANTPSTINLTLPMAAGESVHAQCPSGLITVTVSGIEQ